jgi:hypothetical protein
MTPKTRNIGVREAVEGEVVEDRTPSTTKILKGIPISDGRYQATSISSRLERLGKFFS